MALSPQPVSTFDLGFFRNTGLALVFATLVAGAMTLFLAVEESQSQKNPREMAASEIPISARQALRARIGVQRQSESQANLPSNIMQ